MLQDSKSYEDQNLRQLASSTSNEVDRIGQESTPSLKNSSFGDLAQQVTAVLAQRSEAILQSEDFHHRFINRVNAIIKNEEIEFTAEMSHILNGSKRLYVKLFSDTTSSCQARQFIEGALGLNPDILDKKTQTTRSSTIKGSVLRETIVHSLPAWLQNELDIFSGIMPGYEAKLMIRRSLLNRGNGLELGILFSPKNVVQDIPKLQTLRMGVSDFSASALTGITDVCKGVLSLANGGRLVLRHFVCTTSALRDYEKKFDDSDGVVTFFTMASGIATSVTSILILSVSNLPVAGEVAIGVLCCQGLSLCYELGKDRRAKQDSLKK